MNQLENCQARYRSNTWMGRTRTDGPDEFEPTKFDCISSLNFPKNEKRIEKGVCCSHYDSSGQLFRFFNGIGATLV